MAHVSQPCRHDLLWFTWFTPLWWNHSEGPSAKQLFLDPKHIDNSLSSRVQLPKQKGGRSQILYQNGFGVLCRHLWLLGPLVCM